MKKIRNADFIVTLPDEVAGLELGSNDSVTLRVYTVNGDNYYQFDYAGGLVPDEQKVDASCMVTMESGVVQLLVTAHIADSTMPDGFLDIAEEVPTDYYWVKSQNESAQEQINQLRRDLAEETEIREAADDALEERMDDLEDEVDTISVEITEISGQVETNTTAIEDINLQLDNFNDWQERQDAAIEEISGKVGTNTSAIATERTARENADISLGASITAETYQRQQADTALSGAITAETAERNAAIQLLEATHNEDIEYLGNTKLDIADFEAYTGSTSTDIADVKTKEGIISGQVQSNLVQIQTLEIKKMDVSGMTTYATKAYTDTGLATKQNTLTAGSGITIDANNVISNTASFDPTILDDYATKQYVDDAVDAIDLSDYQPVSGMSDYATTASVATVDAKFSDYQPTSAMTDYATTGDLATVDAKFADYQPVSAMTDYATTGQVDTLATEVAGKLDATAYTPFDPSVLADYATLDYADAISGVTEEIADTLDQATEVTARSLNELRNNKLDVSAYTPFDPSVLADYQPTSAMTDYATTGQVDTLATEVSGKLDASAYTFDADDYYDKDDIDANNQNIAAALNALNTKKLDTSAYTPFNPSVLSAYQPVSGMSAYATTGDVATIETEVAGKLDTSAYTAFDPSVLAGYQPVSAMSGYYTSDQVDNAERATSAALNELNLRFGSYQPTSGMSGYATTTYVDTQIGNINTALNNILNSN